MKVNSKKSLRVVNKCKWCEYRLNNSKPYKRKHSIDLDQTSPVDQDHESRTTVKEPKRSRHRSRSRQRTISKDRKRPRRRSNCSSKVGISRPVTRERSRDPRKQRIIHEPSPVRHKSIPDQRLTDLTSKEKICSKKSSHASKCVSHCSTACSKKSVKPAPSAQSTNSSRSWFSGLFKY